MAKNGNYGVYNGSGTLSIQNNLIWGHGTNTYRISSSAAVTSNPLFVSSSDLKLQASSPARKKANDGSDLGCYPYQSGTPDRIVISPASASVVVKGTKVFTATVYDATNNPVAVTPSWAAVNGGGTLSIGGLFTAGTKAGTYNKTVQVTASGLSATASVVVQPGPLNRLDIKPSQVTLAAGKRQQFSVTGADLWGNNVAPSKLVWGANKAAGTIGVKGLFTAGAKAGQWPSGVTATAGNIKANASITVTVPKPPVTVPPAGEDTGCSCNWSAAPATAADTSALPLLALALMLGLLLLRRRS